MKLVNKFVVNQIGEKFIAVPVGTQETSFNGMIKLNETAAFIFEQLNNEISYDELTAKLSEHFGCTKEDAKENVDYILAGLKEQNLIEE